MRTSKEQEKDEEVLQAIVQAASAIGRKVQPHNPRGRTLGSLNGFGVVDVYGGPCCAVGAGIIYSGLAVKNGDYFTSFAEAYGVSRAFALGVSDGFEALPVMDEWDSDCLGAYSDYLRGVAVGEAAYSALEGSMPRKP